MYRARGSSLIECLVALAVFAIGAAAHATWLAHSASAHLRASRSFATTTLVWNLASRMRANPEGLRQGHYTNSANLRECVEDCDAVALASADLMRFRREIAARLGKGTDGRVTCDVPSSCLIRVERNGLAVLTWTVEWPDSEA